MAPDIPTTLSPAQIADLRQQVVASQYRRDESDGRRAGVVFEGGPLNGIRIAIDAWAASCPEMEWCVPTREGLRRVRYRCGRGDTWVFVDVVMAVNPWAPMT